MKKRQKCGYCCSVKTKKLGEIAQIFAKKRGGYKRVVMMELFKCSKCEKEFSK